MMDAATADITRLVDHCRTTLGVPDLWVIPRGYPDSLALCVIDSLYSTGSHYSAVVNVINRYRVSHGATGGARALRASIDAAGGPRPWAENVAVNVKPANTRAGAPLKAAVIADAAALMADLGIDTVPELVAAVSERPQDNHVRSGWLKLTSQSSGVTYNYLLILAGLPSVKPDRMVRRFLAEALGHRVDTQAAVDLIATAARILDVNPRTLDHVIWRAASGREPYA